MRRRPSSEPATRWRSRANRSSAPHAPTTRPKHASNRRGSVESRLSERMYEAVLVAHSWIRWFALVSAFGATLAVIRNQVQGDRSIADRWGLMLIMSLDLQLLLGLLLYLVVSPNMQVIRADFGGAMKDPVARFWAV